MVDVGGYILFCDQRAPPDVPLDNYIFYLEAIRHKRASQPKANPPAGFRNLREVVRYLEATWHERASQPQPNPPAGFRNLREAVRYLEATWHERASQPKAKPPAGFRNLREDTEPAGGCTREVEHEGSDMDVVLGLDVGTTNIKVTAIGADGQSIGGLQAPTPRHTVPLETGQQQPGEEFDPEELCRVCAGLTREWTAQFGAPHRVRGIAVASFGEAGLLLDERSQPLTSIIAWHDPRTIPYVEPASAISFGCHTAHDRYYMIGGLMSGAVVDWASRLLAGSDSPEAVAGLMELAATSPLGARGLWFQPYLDGAGSYLRDPNAWGAWLGLRLHHSRADVVRSLVEGLSYGIRGLTETMEEAAGIEVKEMRAVGGGTRNAWWQQVKADILGIPIETPAVSDVAAQGAALLAGIGAGLFSDTADAVRRTYRPAAHYQPNAENHVRYIESYRTVFKNLYPALKAINLGETANAQEHV